MLTLIQSIACLLACQKLIEVNLKINHPASVHDPTTRSDWLNVD